MFALAEAWSRYQAHQRSEAAKAIEARWLGYMQAVASKTFEIAGVTGVHLLRSCGVLPFSDVPSDVDGPGDPILSPGSAESPDL